MEVYNIVFFFQAEDGIRDIGVTGVQTCALPILVLKNNILGVSENGWKFNASELRYNKATDEIISEAGVAAINEKKGIHLEGKKFLTTTSMSRSEEHTSELQSRQYLVCRLLLEKNNYLIRPCPAPT